MQAAAFQWSHRVGDGREEALEHSGNGFYIPLERIRTLADVRATIGQLAEKSWVTTGDLAYVTGELLLRVERMKDAEDERRRERQSTLDSRASALAFAAGVVGAAVFERRYVPIGTRFGGWTYVLDEAHGPSLAHRNYSVSLSGLRTREEVARLCRHLTFKEDLLTTEDMAAGIQGVLAVLLGGELRGAWKRSNSVTILQREDAAP